MVFFSPKLEAKKPVKPIRLWKCHLATAQCNTISLWEAVAYRIPKDTGYSWGERICPVSLPWFPVAAQKAPYLVCDACTILWGWMTVTTYLFSKQKSTKHFVRILVLLAVFHFGFLFKKKNESQQSKYHQEGQAACRSRLNPCCESDSDTGSCCPSLLHEQLQAGLLLQSTTDLATEIHQDLQKGSQNRGETPTATAEDITYCPGCWEDLWTCAAPPSTFFSHGLIIPYLSSRKGRALKYLAGVLLFKLLPYSLVQHPSSMNCAPYITHHAVMLAAHFPHH